MNVISFTGNLGADVQLSYTKDATSVATISVPIKSGFGKSEKTNWVRCTIWGKRADALAPYLKKGATVGIVGEASVEEYTAKDGSVKCHLSVKVSDITLLGKQAKAVQNQDTDKRHNEPMDDDIPF